MFAASEDSTSRRRSALRSTDDRSSTKERPRRFFRRYARGLSISSQSLATTSSHHDELPIPSPPIHAFLRASVQSTPMTSPSTAYSSPFPGSLSSAISESVPNAESKHQSEFGCLTSGFSSAHSPVHGSASSSSSHPVSPWSRSTTESDSQASAPQLLSKRPSDRPLTAPHSPPTSQAAGDADDNPVDHHTRSHSRLTINIKNLLSAVPSPSRFTFNSTTTVPSDTESSSRSFRVPPSAGKRPTIPRKSRPFDLEVSNSVSSAMPSPGYTSNAPTDAHRRYVSEAAAEIHGLGTSNGPPADQDSLDVPVQDVPLPSTRAREPKTRNVLRRHLSSSVKHFKGRERGMSSPSRLHEGDADRLHLPSNVGVFRQGGLPFPITAVDAVAMAYKQQELHSDGTSFSKLSIEDQMSSSMSHCSKYDRDYLEPLPTPYSTVLGSSSEHRVQTDGSYDRLIEPEADQYLATTQAGSSSQPLMARSVGRSLTRKVSSRWRKVKEGNVLSKESSTSDRGHSRGLPDLQGIWRVDKSAVQSTRRSIDATPNAVGGAWASPVDGHMRSRYKGDESDSGRLWQLMRRISTGSLRERFQSDKVVPPVPTIPKALLENVSGGERSIEPLSPSRCQPLSPLRDREHTETFMASKNTAVTRSHVATASSSPNSSDVASMQFFHQAHSARTSVSSYGEPMVVLRIADTALDRHIITPLEQLRLGDDHTQCDDPSTSSVLAPRSPRRSMSVPGGLKTVEDAESDHVPLPSLSWVRPGESPSSSSSRPPSTSASASGSACTSYQGRNLGGGGSRMKDGTVSLSPPPRSARNSGRGASGSMTSSHSHSKVVTQVEDDVMIRSVRHLDRVPSGQSDMTARIESPEPGRPRGHGQGGDQDASPRTDTQLTFRELDSPRRVPLSEREKADIWNDLLARSDRAGGTLHINGARELMSDSLRFSTHSEVADVLPG